MGEFVLIAGISIVVATITSVVLVLLVQKRRSKAFSAHLVEWENVQKRSQQIWEIQQEKRGIELEHALAGHVQRVKHAWKKWEAKDMSRIASAIHESNAKFLHTALEHEIVRLPYTDEVPLKESD